MKTLIDKAEVLIEALPYMRRFVNKTIVIKYGGHAMTEEELRASFAIDVVLLKHIGIRPVIVHGGGPQIGETMTRLGLKPQFVQGIRVTDDQTMEVVEMVLGGRINQEIVQLIERGGARALGLTGKDGSMIRVERKLVDGQDVGRVGKICSVDPYPIRAAADAGFIPVVSPLGVDVQGLSYNVNADDAAGALAAALGAEKLILLTDVDGVKDATGKLLHQLSEGEIKKLKAEGTIREGMVPKVECCLDAIRGGVSRAHIVDGRTKHAILLEVFTDHGIGTLITL